MSYLWNFLINYKIPIKMFTFYAHIRYMYRDG